MVVTFCIGNRCAVMLPRKFINPQVTPAKGLIINTLLDGSCLILVEEVWQFKGLKTSPLSEMCLPSGRIRQANWGWQEVPSLVKDDDYLMLPAQKHNLMEISGNILDKMIEKSIIDFRDLNSVI